MAKKTPRERFEAFVIRQEIDGCWIWVGGRRRDGGQFNLAGRTECAHRAAWMIYKGDIPKQHYVSRICATPGCVNPGHLVLLNQKELNRRTSSALKKLYAAHPEKIPAHIRKQGA